MRILLAGGGTAGHTSPLIATADALRRISSDASQGFSEDVQISCLGTPRGLETRVIPAAGYPLELIPPVPLPRRPSMDLLAVPWRLRAAISATRDVIERLDPAVIAGFGGYVSTPAYLASRALHRRLVIHEGNALPGLANRLGARFCTDIVATSFPGTRLPHAVFVGLPIRRAISTLDRAAMRPVARQRFGLEPGLPTLLVTGGSQGARRINQAVGPAAADLGAAGIQVLHVCGPKGSVDIGYRPAGAPPYVVVDFVEDMDLAYAAADVMIGRAGANSVTEAAALGIPSVFVPLPIGNGEQARNAASVVAAGGAVLVSDADFTTGWIRTELIAMMTDPLRLAAMSAAATGLIRRDADDQLARMILEAAR